MLGNSTCLDVENDENCNLCVIITVSKAHSSGRTSIIYCMKLNTVDTVNTVEGHPFRLSKPNFQYIWDNDEVTNEKIQFGSVVKYTEIGKDYLYGGNTKRARIDVDFIQMNLAYGESAFRGIIEAFPDAKIPCKGKGIYQNYSPTEERARFIGIKYGDIKNERISFVTKLGEAVDLKLNCRANLVLSTSPVKLQIRADMEDDDEVGDVALVKMGGSECSLRNPTYQGVCEGLILKYKPQTISIDEEPVKIQDGDGNIILVPGTVKFDTGNDAGTAISKELGDTLGLKPDSRKKRKVHVTGGYVIEYKKVTIKLFIRKRQFIVDALFGAVASGTDLLVGMEIIKRLNGENFTLGI